MGLLDQAKSDWLRYTSDKDTGFGVDIDFVALPGAETASIVGLATKHHISIDTDGNPVNTKNAHISISEQLLIDNLYPIRNGNDEVSLLGHKVIYKDSTGVAKEYVITEHFPDETIGIITCILGDFE